MKLYVYDARTNAKTALPPYTQTLSDYANGVLSAADRDFFLALVQSIVTLIPADLLRTPDPGAVHAPDGTIGIVRGSHFIPLRDAIAATLEYVPETSTAKKINAAQRRELEIALGLLAPAERRLDSNSRAFVPRVTIVAGTGGMLRPGLPVTDIFTITNASDTTVDVALVQPPISGPNGTTILPTGYTVDGGLPSATLPTLPALEGGGSTTIGVQYVVTSGNADDPITCALSATIGVDDSPLPAAVAYHTILPNPSVAITATAAGNVMPGKPATDSFTVQNVSGQPAVISIPNPPAINGPHGTIAPAGYTLSINGAPALTYSNLTALQGALGGPVSDGQAIVVGVSYIAPPGKSGQPVVDALAVTVAAGGLTASSIGIATSTTSPQPQLNVTAISAGTVTPGAIATDGFVLKNASGQPASIAIPNPPAIVSAGGLAVHPASYTLEVDGTQLLSGVKFGALQAKLAVLELHDGGTATIGVQYVVPSGTDGDTVSDTLRGTVQVGGVHSPFIGTVDDVLASTAEAIGFLASDLYAKRDIWKSAQMSDPAAALRDLENYDTALVGFTEAGFRADDPKFAESMIAKLLAIHEMTSDGFENVLASMRNAAADEGSAI